MKTYSPLSCPLPAYDFIVGTGGIGGVLHFLLDGNQTLSRNECRLGRRVDSRDYCRQHIVLHHVSVLLGAASGSFTVYPIGKVGDDDLGWNLLAEMDSVGMLTEGVTATKDAATLFSVCFRYPDSTGSSITTSNGASGLLTAGEVANHLKAFKPEGRGMALAMPEVPLEARIALLMDGRKRGWFNAASISAGEAVGFMAAGGLELCDLLAVSKEEAAALAEISPDTETGRTVRRCGEVLGRRNPDAMLIVADGSGLCWACGDGRSVFLPSPAIAAIGTADAGDALLAGTLAGLACNLPFIKDAEDGFFSETPLGSAFELGILLASFSITSAGTMHREADATALKAHAATHGFRFSKRFGALFPVSMV